jgi:hypothetical protein
MGRSTAADLAKTDQAATEHATGFEPPIYNIWQRQEEITGPRTPWARKKTGPACGPEITTKGGLRQIPLPHRFPPHTGIETIRRISSSVSKQAFDTATSFL